MHAELTGYGGGQERQTEIRRVKTPSILEMKNADLFHQNSFESIVSKYTENLFKEFKNTVDRLRGGNNYSNKEI